ncbi:MAG TPA: ParB/RepB/Spo0J family partition protein [Ruminiclostridium sp.]|nr:ParB/RepB/Spo0J family partition protein [Ruminiclostridium sp.]
MTKRGLGKGLDALFADNAADSASGGSVTLKINEIEPNRGQPRKNFDENALAQLADSIRQHGVLQPLMVRPIPGGGGYQLVAGERRWRASRMAGLTEVPVIIKELDDEQVMAIALIENLQREDLNPVEEAKGYRTLMENFSLTQDEVSQKVGKSRPVIANAMRLLSLPDDVLNMVEDGRLSQGHARTLLALDDKNSIKKLADEIITKGLSVREVEKLVKKQEGIPPSRKPAAQGGVVETEVARCLTERLGRKVSVVSGKNKGVIEIEFYGEDDLKELSKTLAGD